jgi:hypothetical protein
MVESFFKKFTPIYFILLICSLKISLCVSNKNTNIELNDKIDLKLENLIGYYKKLIDMTDKNNPEEVVKNNTIAFIQNTLTDDNQPQVFEPFIWTQLNINNEGPSIRRGHSTIIADNFIVVFGGCYMESTCYNDVYYLDLLADTWISIKTTGSIPTPRQGHSAVLYGSSMWVYGGSSSDGYLNDLYSLNLETVIFIFIIRGSGKDITFKVR